MKLKLINVHIAFIDLFEPGAKYGKFGAQFRFTAESGYKGLLEEAIDEQGLATFKTKWAGIKKSLYGNGKIMKVLDGADKGYSDTYYITLSNSDRPAVRNRDTTLIGASDRVLYPGCRVDVILDISAFVNKKGDSVVSTKLLGVQFRGDDTPFTNVVKAEISDFEPITAGADAEDL